MIIVVSQKSYTRFKLPNDLAIYFGKSIYSKFSRTNLKYLVKQQLSTNIDSSFLETYVVIGHDIPIAIKELVVIC